MSGGAANMAATGHVENGSKCEASVAAPGTLRVRCGGRHGPGRSPAARIRPPGTAPKPILQRDSMTIVLRGGSSGRMFGQRVAGCAQAAPGAAPGCATAAKTVPSAAAAAPPIAAPTGAP